MKLEMSNVEKKHIRSKCIIRMPLPFLCPQISNSIVVKFEGSIMDGLFDLCLEAAKQLLTTWNQLRRRKSCARVVGGWSYQREH